MAKKSAVIQRMTRRTTEGLCDSLFDEFDSLRSGQSDVHRASAVAKLATQIIAVKQLEIDAAALVKRGIKLRPLVFQQPARRIGLQR